MSEPGYQERIRAVVQNLSRELRRGSLDGAGPPSTNNRLRGVPHGVIPTIRDDFIGEIQELMQRTRGRELPCTFNSMIVANLFAKQAGPWEIVRKHVDKVQIAVKAFLGLVVGHVADPGSRTTLSSKCQGPDPGSRTTPSPGFVRVEINAYSIP